MVFACDGGCNRSKERADERKPDDPSLVQTSLGGAPTELDLPPPPGEGWGDPLHTVDLSGQQSDRPLAPPQGFGACPPDMVLIAGAFCIDRYEASLVDRDTDRALSPHYPPSPTKVGELLSYWSLKAPTSRRALGRSLPVPEPPAFQLTEKFYPKAISVEGVLPAGYLSHDSAEAACVGAGKRLCTMGEWVRACKGQRETRFPYGETYRHGVCNVHRESHPAGLLHGNSSEYHSDPRLGLVGDAAGPLLRRTGETPECASLWGADAVYDMVGNLDEWIADETGVFVGGFYSRATREGCDAIIDVHAPSYFDYSLGTRCCRDP